MNYGDFAALFTDIRKKWAYVADIDTHEILFMTAAAMEAVGIRSEEEYGDRKCYQVFQGLDAPCEFCTNRQLLEGESYIREQYNPVVKQWLRLENYLFDLDGRRCRGEWVTDISQDRNTITSLRHQLELEQVLMKSIRTLALEPDVHTAVNLFLQYIGNYYQADRACIFEINHHRQVVNNTYEWCNEGILSEMARFQNAPLAFVADWVEHFQGDAAHQIDAAPREGEADIDGVLNSRGVKNLLIVPLRKGETMVGFLGVDNAKVYVGDTSLLRLSADLITEEFQKRQLIWDLGGREFTDRLTELHNRRKYLKTLQEYEKHPPRSLAVFFLDLNGLKELNESLGHDAGDHFICQCADILHSLNLNAYRVDGDEFVILQTDADEETARRKELSLRMEMEKLKPNTVSVGFAWGTGDVDVLSLINQADERMYAEKQVYYRNALSQSRGIRVGMATDVLQEIRDGNFVVYYQPQVDLQTGGIYGAEALVRKLDRDGSLIFPDRFVPFYEAEGVISHMDLHVLELVCAMLRTWRERLGKCPHISVNLSRLTLMEPDVVSRVSNTCKAYGVDPGQITIEVTESTGKLSQEQLQSLVMGLQESGFAVSLDDFGSRYSNLSILTSIDFQLIKLDKSLIDQIGVEEKGTKIVKNLIQLCKDTISTPSLAEGVETREQARMLREFRCDYVQGYYFSRPIPADAFSAMLEADTVYPL